MHEIHYLYQYSLESFMDSIYELIKDNLDINEIPKNNPDLRLNRISDAIFKVIYREISPSLLQKDKNLFGLRLAQIKMGK